MQQMGSFRKVNSLEDVLEGDREARERATRGDFGHFVPAGDRIVLLGHCILLAGGAVALNKAPSQAEWD